MKQSCGDLNIFFLNNKSSFSRLFANILKELIAIKFQICLHVLFLKNHLSQVFYICSKCKELTSSKFIDREIARAQSELEIIIDLITERGSGWTLSKIVLCEVRVGKFIPHKGGCFKDFPAFIRLKKACINPRTDNNCFMYAILASLHPQIKSQRLSVYDPYIKLYNFTGCFGLVDLTQITKFSRLNDISINVYSFSLNRNLLPIQVETQRKPKHVNLLLHNEHYFCIRNFRRLASSSAKWQRYFCYKCLYGFRDLNALANHEQYCDKPQKLILPSKSKNILRYNSFHKEIKFPCVIYADFETLATPPINDEEDNFENKIYQEHQACSYGYIVIDWTGKIIINDFYRGENAALKFLYSILENKSTIYNHIQSNKKDMEWTAENKHDFENATICWLCGGALGEDRVRDHDHFTGKFRGAAHQNCNLKYTVPRKIPILFHNLKNFDSHLIISALQPHLFKRIQIIPHNIEKFTAFTADSFIFLDSYAFLASSLDALSSNLLPPDKNPLILQLFKSEDIPFISNKGTLPYDYLDCLEKFDEVDLPSIDKFYNKLYEREMKPEEYEKVKNFWQHFQCKDLGHFQDIYLKTDVVLLAAVFERFRRMTIFEFGLDPCHYFSSPGLTWAAMLRYTKAEIELLTDVDMLMMIEKGIRGGMTSCNLRYCKANNKYLDDWDESEESTFISYLDVNNLYGYALSQPLPIKGFKWIDPDQIDSVLRDNYVKNGYILEVDLLYPENLHDLHNDYPLAPEKTKIEAKMLSRYQTELVSLLSESGYKRIETEKLVSSFLPRER